MKSRTSKKAFAEFHGKAPSKSVRAHVPLPPKRAFLLGEVVEIVYKRPGEKVPYAHSFKRRRPMLVADARGKHLFFVAGDYTVTERGIVG
jgi:hypothetical protein